MLRVCQLIPTLDRAGAEKQMAMLAAGLPRDRFHVEVAALTRLGPLEADLRAADVPVTLIGKRHKADPLALVKLTKYLKQGRFDILQTWIFAANTYGRLAARRAGVPVVVTAEMAVDLWKGRTQLAIDRKLAAWTDRLVGNSRAVVDFYAKHAGVPTAKLEMIYSGIPSAAGPPIDTATARAELGIAPETKVVLYAGRLAEQKGVEDLVKAMDVLQHVRPDYLTMIAGDGPLRERLEDRAAAFELGRRIRFLGHREDVPRLLAAADLIVLPSRYEGLPNIVLEAMQLGKPVVATQAPGTTELVVDQVTGLLVPIGQPVALAQAIMAVLDDPERAQRLGAAGRDRVAADFDADAMIAKFAELYEILARSKGVPG